MDEVTTKVGNSYIASAACKDFESELGWMYAAYYALMAKRYQYENQVPHETLAKIAVKNHLYACSSPYAQQAGKYTVEDVLNSRMIAYPLRILQCCLVTDGGGALILTSAERAGAACVIVIDSAPNTSSTKLIRDSRLKRLPVRTVGWDR